MIVSKSTNQKGVTLVEVILVMGLLSIFLTILATIFTATVDVQSQSKSYSAVTSDGRFVMARLDYDIKRATAITTPNTLGGSSTSLTLTISGVANTYAINSGRLRLSSTTATDFLTTNDVTISALTFQRLGNVGGKDSVHYSFTLTSNVVGKTGAETQTYTSTAERR